MMSFHSCAKLSLVALLSATYLVSLATFTSVMAASLRGSSARTRSA